MFKQKTLEKLTKPIKAVSKNCARRWLPNLTKVYENIKFETDQDPELKKNLKKNIRGSIVYTLLELASAGIPGYVFRHFPRMNAILQFRLYNGAPVNPAPSKLLSRTVLWLKLSSMNSFLLGIVSDIYDAKSASTILAAERRNIHRELGLPIPEDDGSKIFRSGRKFAKEIGAGMRANKSLRRKFYLLTASEMVADLIDVSLGMSRNAAGVVITTAIAQAIALKDLDITVQAFREGAKRRALTEDMTIKDINSPVLSLIKMYNPERSKQIAHEILSSKILTRTNIYSNDMIEGGLIISGMDINRLLCRRIGDPSDQINSLDKGIIAFFGSFIVGGLAGSAMVAAVATYQLNSAPIRLFPQPY